MSSSTNSSASPGPMGLCPAPRKVLVTGSAGAVGKAICPVLIARGHTVRGLDCRSTPNLADSVQADLTDGEAIDRAMQGMDTIVHLAAYPNDADFIAELVRPNIIGLYHVMNAARQHKVARVILASSAQVINGLWKISRERVITLADGTRLTNHYGLTKLFAEEMGEMYARLYGISVLAVRIGWLARDPADLARVARSNAQHINYLSHNDCARLFTLAVEAEHQGFSALFATSKSDPGTGLDGEPARRVLGYEPQDWYPEGSSFA